jgi:acetylornithine/succinyldiaminopimelate/putrescine aminotransferase
VARFLFSATRCFKEPAMTAALAEPHVMNTYARLPVALARGQGSRMWDTNGKE